MSKGSTRRPRFVPLAELESAWARTFGKAERQAAIVSQLEEQASRAAFAAVDRAVEAYQLNEYVKPYPSRPSDDGDQA